MARKRSKPGKRKVHRLTPKQTRLLIRLAKGRTLTQAAPEAGYSPKNPSQSGHQALESIRKTAPDLLARHDLDDDAIIEKHLIPMLNAEETKFFPYSKKGRRLLLERNVVAWGPRGIATDMLMKIRGLYIREAENQGPQFSVVIINAANRPPWSQMKRANQPAEVESATMATSE